MNTFCRTAILVKNLFYFMLLIVCQYDRASICASRLVKKDITDVKLIGYSNELNTRSSAYLSFFVKLDDVKGQTELPSHPAISKMAVSA